MTQDIWRDIYSGKKYRKKALMQWWDTLSNARKNFVIISVLFLFAVLFTALYGFCFAPDTKNGQNFYYLHRNLAIAFFGIFGGGLAIWGRIAQQTQLKHTETQIENSLAVNRNDHFAEALEMLGEDKSNASHKGALYLLHGLIKESPENEYIRCVEIITDWLKEEKIEEQEAQITGKIHDTKKITNRPLELIQMATDIFRRKKSDKLQNNIVDHKIKFAMYFWPNLQRVNLYRANLKDVYLERANLRSANLRSANMVGANLRGANLIGANLERAILRNTNFQGAILVKATLNWEGLKEANLQRANLRGIDLTGENLEGLNLKGINLINANLQGANLRGVNLSNARLGGANLQGADLKDANLQDANLQDANLKEAKLKCANLQGAFISATNMTKVKGLIKKQILQTTFKVTAGSGRRPKLPSSLAHDSDIEKWLNHPPFRYRR